jgi:hypothetical protein
MDANVYKDKFLEAEEQASELLEELKKLKDEVDHNKEVGEKFDAIVQEINELVPRIDHTVYELNNFIQGLKEIGTEEIISSIDTNFNGIESIINSHHEENNIKDKKFQKFIYLNIGLSILIIGISILMNILIIYFK